jgi:hypothetical protein
MFQVVEYLPSKMQQVEALSSTTPLPRKKKTKQNTGRIFYLLLTKRKVMGFYSCGYIPLGSKTPFPCWI